MLNHLKKIFLPESLERETIDENKKLQVATCAIFIEMAKADSSLTREEEEKIISIMKSSFDLDDDYIDELFELAEADIKESISLYEFTTILDQNLNKEEKYEVMKNIWRLIYVDEKLDKYEDQLVKRIGVMLNLDFREVIAAKLEAKKEINS
ncbi:MAG: TerB family tellurite resistance protein [Ignavibacteriaceae bacterium]